ncbi:DUF4354 family protein [Serratia sp. M24T3]|uniref:DUF4354 family protein n=1 Tax=Serratia sp. M24T3 TaxID=932213 RepID=UPI00025B916D|nr:DUF4354 family protein [Serratia sp. M24T3]EIC84045.1 hypothetical protein SPM24T3_14060 [Serratia sp. M24T3]
MKVYTIVLSLALSSICVGANATTLDNIGVYSTQESQGSVSIGSKNAYTKTFEVVLANLSGESVDISKLCLKAYSKDNKEFNLDTVDEKLTSGMLKYGKPVKGNAVFSSDNDEVLNAALVKISDDCN